ncbi:hypothetical protein Egran_02984 [Elaphomyces granulatus]|uniref:Uncharacterized protein n=1 Tax=Elaphomyces granulatus TaxID=519963 RepID=A0A232LYQ4_9EURO|nr:hypothetical protein Egran_02984 [Elaphomyces granulatus]
MALDSRNSN